MPELGLDTRGVFVRSGTAYSLPVFLLSASAGRIRRVVAAVSFTAILVGASLIVGRDLGVVLLIAGIAGVVAVYLVPAIYDLIPGLRLLPSRNGLNRLQVRLGGVRNRTLRPPKAIAEDPYRAALRRTSRWLYVVEAMLSQANGGGKISDDGIDHEPADKPWGDDFYRQLGLPPEDEYR